VTALTAEALTADEGLILNAFTAEPTPHQPMR
jgi:hypothetical protein